MLLDELQSSNAAATAKATTTATQTGSRSGPTRWKQLYRQLTASGQAHSDANTMPVVTHGAHGNHGNNADDNNNNYTAVATGNYDYKHPIRHHKSHGQNREVGPSASPSWMTHKSWTSANTVTDRKDIGWWIKSESETDSVPGSHIERTHTQTSRWFSTTATTTATTTSSSNATFPSLTLESKPHHFTTTSTFLDQQLTTESVIAHDDSQLKEQQLAVLAKNISSSYSSATYPDYIPSIAEYATSQQLPSQAGLPAYLSAGGEQFQSNHLSTSSLYNIVETAASNASSMYNISQNGMVNDSTGSPWQRPVIEITFLEVVIAVLLSGFILAIIIGNMFVILSVALFRDMRTLTNGLIVSLASADLLVAIIVLPISLYHEIAGTWTLGPYICDFWITSDVFCCTASILNIVVIAVDRYWLITKNVRYTHNGTFPRQRVVVILCFLAWVTSGIISSSPLFGWQDGSENLDPYMCIISQDLGYTIFSTFGAFWFPLSVILLVYMKIFKIARRRAKTRAKAQAIHPSMNSTVLSEANGKPSRYSRPSKSDSNSPQTSPKMLPRRRVSTSHSKRSHRGRIRSSARTLGLIIGGFVLCWLPFFLLATILPFCEACQVPPYVMSIVLWLGYSNSLLNPAIYAIWDKNFRRSFKRLATCSVMWSHVL